MPSPNILLLHTDQQRFDTIAALGANHMHTPNLDRLVACGTTFTRAYSANPVCMPARHDLITGTSARHHGYWGNSRTPVQDYALQTLPRMLTWHGYQTIGVGKMHFNPEREHHGFAHMDLMEELPSCRENDTYLQYLEQVGCGHIRCQHGVRPLFYHVPQIARVPEEHHGSAWVAHKTIEYIKTRRDRPFFLFASWVGPHPPLYVPSRYFDMYRGAAFLDPCPLPEGMDSQAPPTPENVDPKTLQRVREAYFGAISLIDTHIGRILDALEETGQMDNTVVLFTSDHGEMLGDRGGYQKHVPYEGSAHIPLIACGPGFTPGQCDTPATTWDTAATILDAAGVTVPDTHPLVGASLRTLAATSGDRIAVYHNSRGRRRYVAAASRTHKFIHWYNGGEEELYDLQADPWEQHNLLADPGESAQAIGDPLKNACLVFEQEHGPSETVRDNAFVNHPYETPNAHTCSLHPTWSYNQFPHWTDGYSQEDLDLIADEMRDCLKNDGLFIHTDPEWRKDALRIWKKMGGDPAVYEALFSKADKE